MWHRPTSVAPSVYLIRAETSVFGIDGALKIGFTRYDPAGRVAHLQIGCPFPLVLIGYIRPGSVRLEKQIHGMFARHRLQGEWFRPHAEILNFFFTRGHRMSSEHCPAPPYRLPRQHESLGRKMRRIGMELDERDQHYGGRRGR
jgi:hypothetical protein